MKRHGMLPLILVVLQLFSHARSQKADCQTPQRVSGNCIELSQCNELMSILRQGRPDNYEYLRQSQCGFSDGNPKVCCPIRGTTVRPGGTVLNPRDRGTRDPSNSNISTSAGTWSLLNPLLPQSCGEEITQALVGGEKVDIYEYPWMALLEYNTPSGKTTACGGVLISKRYVLTAAHCVKGKDLPKSWTLASVRLGEYDTSTDPDCVPDADGSWFCIATPLTVGIQKQIIHEGYSPQSNDQVNDIALVRLSRNISFTNFIRPICLPPVTPTDYPFFYVAGWGTTALGFSSTVKLNVKILLVNDTQCTNAYPTFSIRIGNSQLCAGGERGRDTCRGDSGGPLMTPIRTNEDKLQWTVVGVVSIGYNQCGAENWPRVYTKVTSFMPWIISKLKA